MQRQAPRKLSYATNLAKKRLSYLERVNSELSREERERDPVYAQVKALNLAQYARAGEALGESQIDRR